MTVGSFIGMEALMDPIYQGSVLQLIGIQAHRWFQLEVCHLEQIRTGRTEMEKNYGNS